MPLTLATSSSSGGNKGARKPNAASVGRWIESCSADREFNENLGTEDIALEFESIDLYYPVGRFSAHFLIFRGEFHEHDVIIFHISALRQI